MNSVFTDSILPWIEVGCMVEDIWCLVSDYIAFNPCEHCGKFVDFDHQCLELVRKNPKILKALKQTPELCMAAVQQDGQALVFVKNQTPELCMAAVQQDGQALEFVKKQTPELCMAAVQEDPKSEVIPS